MSANHWTIAGLSPRVRGNLTPGDVAQGTDRSIPASAGEPGPWRLSGPASKVYPRECGGTRYDGLPVRVMAGLSPRVRGNRVRVDALPGERGSIPASAGEPCGTRQRWHPIEVYPRECGGTPLPPASPLCTEGLSPRVRGNQHGNKHGTPHRGSIPASAGEPTRRRRRGSGPGVYPRECGGTRHASRRSPNRRGLSPRVRGNRRLQDVAEGRRGSIPASAGEPPRCAAHSPPAGVYPRECGGTRLEWRDPRWFAGLSPRVRGNHRLASRREIRSGSIPASAGEPDAAASRLLVRGGLSPRVRGNPVAQAL